MAAGIGHVLDIAPGAEMPLPARQHQRPTLRVIGHHRQYRAQFLDHLQAHGVAAVRAIEGDVKYAAVAVQQQGLAHGEAVHGFFPGRMLMSLQMMPSMISSAPPPIDTRRTSR